MLIILGQFVKLIKYLKDKYQDYGNRELKRALEAGACLVNGKIERYASREIDPRKDKIKFTKMRIAALPRLVVEAERIIYEDEQILVYDKAAGHSMMATEKSSEANLTDELKKLYKYIEPVHRLDKQTSGLILFAKDAVSLKELMRQFKDKEVQKEYEAVVDGVWTGRKQGRIDNQVQLARKIGAMQLWQVVPRKSSRSKQAITDYKVLEIYKQYTHISLRPVTGRTHQLRVHMADMGHPILGDAIYAENFKSALLFERHLLHAAKLSFKHPLTSKRLEFKAPRPSELAALL